MSRCFPYPPPGYSLSRASNDALIESIKLQKEREKEKARAERKKEKKREKKEKRKERKEKAKQKSSTIETKDPRESGYFQKKRDHETEQLERSSLTEEHELPITLHKPSYSSDSTENSNKRRRHSSPFYRTENSDKRNKSSSACYGSSSHANVIRIRLPSQKQMLDDTSAVIEQPCSTSGRVDTAGPSEHESGVKASAENTYITKGTIKALKVRPPKLNRELTSAFMAAELLDSRLSAAVPAQDSRAPAALHVQDSRKPAGCDILYDNKWKRIQFEYRDLVENWVPPGNPNQHLDLDDQEWLFTRKNQRTALERKSDTGKEIVCSSSCLFSPHEQYLQEAGIYALPFTVPF